VTLEANLVDALGYSNASWSAEARELLESELAEELAMAKSYWSELAVEPAAAIAYLAARMQVSEVPGVEEVRGALATLVVADLVLCCALAAGDAQALRIFERAFGQEIERAVGRIDSSGDLRSEVRQVLRDKLFVAGEGERLGIESYAGRGPLGRWLWVMATREALMSRRRLHRETPLVDLDAQIADGNLELDFLKREYRAEFRIAFAEAMTGLSAKERNLLRYHFVQTLTIDQIGAIYRVHRVTAFRWLRSARQALVAATRSRVAKRLDVQPAEVDSILRLVQSQLELSVERVLGDA
jgi:RNA polymerase sigma-70 factor (ECF subfamily)